MATKNKSKSPVVSAITLAQIVAAGAEGMFTPSSVHAPMVEAGTVEINPALVDAEGNVATRATQKGIETVNTPANTDQAAALQTPAPKSAFVIEDGIDVPTISGRGRTGTTYPFEQLAVGQSFFVPNDEKKTNAAKSLASTVSSATARYAVEAKDGAGNTITETVKVKTFKKGEDGKNAKDENGKPIVESETTETRPKMIETRKFVVRSVEGGARIWRTA